ncbi:MAG: primosomal protein N' [Candidatus Babeliaceae bacterium]|jgi:primosomal protein N' (replication factor Y)
MYINVKLLNGFQKELTYKVPASLNLSTLIGTIVHVPLQKRTEAALVVSATTELAIMPAYTIRELYEQDTHTLQIEFAQFIKRLAEYYHLDPIYFYKRIRHFLHKEPENTACIEEELSLTLQNNTIHNLNITLTMQQQQIVDAITPHVINPSYQASLIHGVTGSGKTEIYKQLITTAYEQGKSTIFLLPEVSLAVQFTHVLRSQLPYGDAIYGFHSAISTKEKLAMWHDIEQQRPVVILGVHLPMLLPIKNLGLIVVDEEHDIGYQEKKHPKVNSKEAALLRAQAYNIPIILGSATPSITSLHAVKTKKWHFFELHERFAGAFPTLTIVPLISQKQRNNFWITQELENAVRKQLEKKEQSIIFINRRGYSFFVQCLACSHIISCNSCSVSLTVHNDDTLRCHYCSFQQPMPSQCVQCKGSKKNLLKKGIGTQQIVTILEKLFPTARIARADLDATINKKKWSKTIQDFKDGAYDILVGTQTVTKGYHFPKVTLVGIIWADIQLGFPFYNATETTVQQIIQVAGRAGRQSAESSVIIQTMTPHPAFAYLQEKEYSAFYDYEIAYRQTLNYPPFTRFIELEIRNNDNTILEHEADVLADTLETIVHDKKYSITILGPAKPPVNKIKNCFIKKIYLKCGKMSEALSLYTYALEKTEFTSSIFFTPNPSQ